MSSVHHLGPFRLDSVLASGGMAEVWRGVHLASGQPVAVKLMRANANQPGLWQSAFRAEVRAMARLNHPSVVRIHDYGTVEEGGLTWLPGTPWLAMELVEGGTLADRAPREWGAVRAVLANLLDALAAAHASDVVHRDIKPANVLVAMDGSVKLTDFGIAHALDRADLAETSTLDGGTPPFMAPEQFEGRFRDTGPWTDLYALGCLAWYLVCGRPPYGKEQNWMRAAVAHAQAPIPALRPLFAVPEELEGWLHRLLQKEPVERFRCAADAHWALSGMSGGAGGRGADDGAVSVDAPTVVRSEAHTQPWRPGPAELPSDVPTRLQTPMPRMRTERSGQPMSVRLPPIPDAWEDGLGEASDPLGGAGLGLFGLREFPLVGRIEERTALWSVLREVAQERSPRLVILTGAAGAGKSRLAEWFARRTRTIGAMTWSIATHGVPPGAGDGTAAMVRRDLALGGLDRGEALARLRTELVASGVLDSDEIVALGSMVAPPNEEELAGGAHTVRFSSPTERHALVERHLMRRSDGRVAGLWLDDAQWGFDALQMSRWMLRTVQGPLLIVAAVRDEALAERSGERRVISELQAMPEVSTLALAPLSRAEQTELLQRWLGLSAALADHVRERTAGNPLFAVQLVGDWVDRDLLVPGARGGFDLRGGALAEIPDDLHATWIGRVDRVVSSGPPSWRPALELAAALGMEITVPEWHALCERSGLILPDGLVDALVRAKLARSVGRDVWRFEHGMLRESIERDARDRARWAAHNLACVSYFRERNSPGRVGRHLFAADRWDEATGPLLEAAAATVFSTHLRRAEASLELAAQALDLAQAPEDDPRRAQVRLCRCRIYGDRGEMEAALRVAGEALAMAQAHGWAGLEADALMRVGEIHRDKPDVPRAKGFFERARTAYKSLGDDRGVALAMHEIGRVAMFAGEFEVARDLHLRAMAMFEKLQVAGSGVANCHRALGELEIRREVDLPAAARHFREAGERYRALGMRFGEASGLNGLAEIARLTGDLEAAEAGYRAAIKLSDAMGHEGGDVMRLNLAICQLQREEYREARAVLERVSGRMAAHERWGLVGFIDALLLVCIAAGGDWSSWPVHAERADRALREARLADRDLARFAERAGDLAQAAGRQAEARQAFALAAWQWEAVGEPVRARDLAER